MKILLSGITIAVASAGLMAVLPASAQEEKAADLDSYSVGERRSIKREEFKVERPKFENSFKLEAPKPSMQGMQFAKPKLEVLSGPKEPAAGNAGNGPIASADRPITPAPQPSAPAGGETRSVKPVSMDPPSYPRDALRREQEGHVVVEFTINTEGRPEDMVVAEAEPRNTFDREALRAVARWRFEPAMRDGRPVPQRIRHTLEFTLND